MKTKRKSPCLRYAPPTPAQPGIIAELLKRSYAQLVQTDPERWLPEQKEWEAFDAFVFDNLATVGQCVFLSWWEEDLVGFGSFDPRQAPDLGIIGHNCILPGFRGRGFGKRQVQEILCRFRRRGIRTAEVSTLSHPFFAPARRMYLSCGFEEVRRVPWERDAASALIGFSKSLS